MKPVKIAVTAVALVLAAGVAAPFFGLDAYKGRVQAALETALKRKVTIQDVRFNLFTGPGFTLTKVVIAEDPALGAEPMAYVETMKAIPRFWSLWSGRLEFSSLRLEDAHLNLARYEPKPGEFRWNFEPLLQPALLGAFPNISLRSGRINFKAENLKSVVYLIDSDLDISPPSSFGDAWGIRFEGKPARTDRPARGSGSFLANGKWRTAGAGELDLDLRLERSEVGDMLALARGEDVGLHGLISGRAHFKGPPSAIGITGRLKMEELHGWDQSIPKGEGWPLALSGEFNVPAQQLKLDARVEGSKVLAVHYRVDKILDGPRWGLSLNLNQFPLQALVPVVRHLGVPVPEGLNASGLVDAAVGYSPMGTLEGQAAFHDAAMEMPGAAPLRFPGSQVLVSQGHARLLLTRVLGAEGDEADLEADYTFASQKFTARLSTSGMGIDSFSKEAGLAQVPLLAKLHSGRWSGSIEYTQQPGSPAHWMGDTQITASTIAVPPLMEPLRVESAQVRIDGDTVSIPRFRGQAGRIAVTGEYEYQAAADRPHRFKLTVPAADAAEIERLFSPALSRNRGLIAMALRLGGAAEPDWLHYWHADGTLQAGLLRVGTMALERVHSRMLWDGTHLAFPDLRAHLEGGAVAAKVHIDLRKAAPSYEVAAQFTDIAWKGGKLDADTATVTQGLGKETLSNLQSTGSFAGRGLSLSPDEFETVSGRYALSWKGIGPVVRLEELRLVSGDDIATGTGFLQDGSTLVLQLSSGPRQVKLASAQVP